MKISKKLSYIELIEMYEKKHGSPGAGKYKIFEDVNELIKKQEERKKQKNKGIELERESYLSNYQAMSNDNPGVG